MGTWVVVSDIFYFHPYLGKILILTNIFQRGWNHQLLHTLPDIQFLLQKKRLPQPLAISTVFVVVLFGDLECGCENRMRFREMTKDLWKSSPVDRRSCWGYEVFVSCQKVVEINPKIGKIHLEIAQNQTKNGFWDDPSV